MWNENITGLDPAGTFRSLNGAANESIFQGRASKAGFFCFFKVWRDMPYDAVLDHSGNLYRVEVKGSSGDNFDVTRGGRAGKQIRRDDNRKRLIERKDCDFVVGVDSANGDCYIIPTDIIEIIGQEHLNKGAIEKFKEKWALFEFNGDQLNTTNRISKDLTRDGLRNQSTNNLLNIANKLSVSVPSGDIKIPHHRKSITSQDDKIVYCIWEHLANL